MNNSRREQSVPVHYEPSPNTPPDHTDIYAALGQLRRRHDDYEVVQKDIADTVERLEEKIDKALSAIGFEKRDEYGKPIGTGVVGRLMRLETRVDGRFTAYDGWVKYLRGGLAVLAVSGTVLWWVVGDKLGSMLK